jgi:hypothetical protein
MSGNNQTDQIGIYGEKGIPSPSNAPGARYSSISWVDNEGSFWIFGGSGYDAGKEIAIRSNTFQYSFVGIFE